MEDTSERSPHWLNYGADQIEAESLVRSVWGDKSFDNLHERGTRVAEEGIEIMQACGGTREQAHRLVDMVFDKKAGELWQEVAGVTFTLLALCANRGFRLDELFDRELARFKAMDPNHFREKQKIKAGLGVSIRLE